MRRSAGEVALRWLRRDLSQLSTSEQNVVQSTAERTAVSRDTNKSFAKEQSFGERVADSIARVGGSWTFIIGFIVFLLLWTGVNALLLAADAFDPYPFIFLNLVLSMIAALQAPVIMMSQNRQAERDRIDATHDYEVNLKAEIEIMALHEKLDELRHRELVAVHEEVRGLAATLERISADLSAKNPPA